MAGNNTAYKLVGASGSGRWFGDITRFPVGKSFGIRVQGFYFSSTRFHGEENVTLRGQIVGAGKRKVEDLRERSRQYLLHKRATTFAAFRAHTAIIKAAGKASAERARANSAKYFQARRDVWGARRSLLRAGSERFRAGWAEQQAWARRHRILTVPNVLTAGRLVACPVLGWAVINGHFEAALTGAALMATTDWLDGYIARNWDQASVVGGFLDPAADKAFVATLGGSLWWAGLLPGPLVAVMLGRDLGLVAAVASHRVRALKQNEGFFDTTSMSFEVSPSLLSKINTGLQMGVITLALAKPVLGFPSQDFMDVLCWGTGATTVLSGFQYAFTDGGMRPTQTVALPWAKARRPRKM